jgi:peptidoglycan/LPS O-acetylase OafA/YrhL
MRINLQASKENNFNVLRLLFASLVLLSHSYELVDQNRSREPLTILFGTISFGELAVDCFFLLSGFLIVQSWCQNPSFLEFLRKRILRIYPAFIMCSLICVFLVAPQGTLVPMYFAKLDFPQLLLEMVQLKAPTTPEFFILPYSVSVNGSMWSIGYEFKCYLGALIFGVLGLFKFRWLWLSMGVGVFLLFLIMLTLERLQIRPEVLGRYPLNNVGNYLIVRVSLFFIAGGTFYLYRDVLIWTKGLTFISLGLLAAGLNFWATAEASLAIFGGYLLFGVAFRKLNCLKLCQSMPDCSYGLYLYAWPIQLVVIGAFEKPHPLQVFAISLPLSVAAGLGSWLFLEKKFLNLKS